MIWITLVLSLATFSGQEFGVARSATAMNDSCPVAKEAIDGRTFATYAGKTVGFCCPGCVKMFDTWSPQRKSAFIGPASKQVEPKQAEPKRDEPKRDEPKEVAEKTSNPWTEPYSLSTCAVLGTELGSMGDPVIKVQDGREVRFCCSGCVPRFEADPKPFLEKVDARMVKDQRAVYPLDRCVVTDVPLVAEGRDVGLDVVYGNRLFRVRDSGARRQLLADPKTFVVKLDAAVVAAQRKSYPLDVCIVTGSELGSMGEPTELIVAGRLFRFCCGGCDSTVLADPRPFIEKVDAARARK